MFLKRSIYNILYSLLNQLIAISLGLILPRLFLTSFGSEVNGLVASVNQIFAYLILLEAGVGSATLQALYKPISQNDQKKISGIMAATNVYYRKTGTIYLFLVLIIAFLYPIFIDNTVPYKTVVLIVILIGMGGVINFFFQGKYKILIQAEGKSYIVTNLATIVNLLNSITRIMLLVLGFNVIFVQSVYLFFTIIQMLFINYYIKKNYKWLNLDEEPDNKAINQKNSAFIHSIAWFIFNNTDIIILTIFGNLKLVSVYVIYNLVFGMIHSIIGTISTGVTFALGQLFNSNKKEFLRKYNLFEVLFFTLSFSMFATVYIFSLPFIRLYTNGITDIEYIDKYLPILFLCVAVLANGRIPSLKVIEFSQQFKETKWQALNEAIINVVVSILCVKFFGIYGVLFGTIVALLYRTNIMILYSNRLILNRKSWLTYKRWLTNVVLLTLVILAANIIQPDLNSYLNILIWAAVYFLIICLIFLFINYLINKEVYKVAFDIVKRYRGRLKFRNF